LKNKILNNIKFLIRGFIHNLGGHRRVLADFKRQAASSRENFNKDAAKTDSKKDASL